MIGVASRYAEIHSASGRIIIVAGETSGYLSLAGRYADPHRSINTFIALILRDNQHHFYPYTDYEIIRYFNTFKNRFYQYFP